MATRTNFHSTKHRGTIAFSRKRFDVVSAEEDDDDDDDDFRTRSSVPAKDWSRSRWKAEASTRLDNFSPVKSLSSGRNSTTCERTPIKETEV